MKPVYIASTLLVVIGLALASTSVADIGLAPVDDTLATTLAQAPPTVTRNGMERFFQPELTEPGATTWLIEQLTTPAGDAARKRGQAEALTRVLADEPGPTPAHQAWVDLITTVEDAAVRDTLVDGLAHADPDTAAAGLRVALAHPSPATRALAALTASLSPHGALVADALTVATRDPSPHVRAQAVRALGVLRGDRAVITALLTDPDPEVAREAERALARR